MDRKKVIYALWLSRESRKGLKEMSKALSAKIGYKLKHEDFAKHLVNNSDWIVDTIAENLNNDR